MNVITTSVAVLFALGLALAAGVAVLALVCAGADTGEAKYLDRARGGAEAAPALFFDAGNLLPKVTSTGAV